ncbi:threonine-phosphate decarboxylase [Oleiphilus messinensis]|nr:threonine-phosphate decarboxylase [Oleiphilus messinensis]
MPSVFKWDDFTHGGNVHRASKEFGIPEGDWLDLSTGINPWPWPVPTLPQSVFQSLPLPSEQFYSVMAGYYDSTAGLEGPGSQHFIQLLPTLFRMQRGKTANVGLIVPTYSDHITSWKYHNHNLVFFEHKCGENPDCLITEIDAALDDLDVLIVVTPNNPTGLHFPRETLLAWRERLDQQGSWLIVDEAFIDSQEQHESLCPQAGLSGLIILRSIGKFFGLAGIRSGFLFASSVIRNDIRRLQGSWPVSGPTLWLTEQCLQDVNWHRWATTRIKSMSQSLHEQLNSQLNVPVVSSQLFSTLVFKQEQEACEIFTALASKGILTRIFPKARLLRVGLPDSEETLHRLSLALNCEKFATEY